jgi:hypothetical protein
VHTRLLSTTLLLSQTVSLILPSAGNHVPFIRRRRIGCVASDTSRGAWNRGLTGSAVNAGLHSDSFYTTRATGIFGGQKPPKISHLPLKIDYFRRQKAYFRQHRAAKKNRPKIRLYFRRPGLTAKNNLFSTAGSLAAENNY